MITFCSHSFKVFGKDSDFYLKSITFAANIVKK